MCVCCCVLLCTMTNLKRRSPPHLRLLPLLLLSLIPLLLALPPRLPLLLRLLQGVLWLLAFLPVSLGHDGWSHYIPETFPVIVRGVADEAE